MFVIFIAKHPICGEEDIISININPQFEFEIFSNLYVTYIYSEKSK